VRVEFKLANCDNRRTCIAVQTKFLRSRNFVNKMQITDKLLETVAYS